MDGSKAGETSPLVTCRTEPYQAPIGPWWHIERRAQAVGAQMPAPAVHHGMSIQRTNSSRYR
jgi:hypothetical protein